MARGRYPLRGRPVLRKDASIRRRPLPPLPDRPPTSQEVAATKTDHFTARDFSGLLGLDGLSERLLQVHFELYQGYVRHANKILDELRQPGGAETARHAELKRRFGWEYDGIRLHELYFENLSRTPAPLDPAAPLHRRLTEDFGSYDAWLKDFRETGAIRGIGWAILYHDTLRNRLFNAWIEQHHQGHLVGCTPILVLDLFEHAYLFDFGVKRADYIDVFLKSVHWDVAVSRFR